MKPSTEGKQNVALISRKVANAVTELVQSAEAIKGKTSSSKPVRDKYRNIYFFSDLFNNSFPLPQACFQCKFFFVFYLSISVAMLFSKFDIELKLIFCMFNFFLEFVCLLITIVLTSN